MAHLITRRRALVTTAAGMAAAAAPFGFAGGQQKTPVGMQLVLAADTSLSVVEERYRMQMDGYLEAFQSNKLLQAIRGLEPPSLAVMFVTWGTKPRVLVPWTLLSGKASVAAFCGHFAAQAASRPSSGIYTRIDNLMRFCITQFDQEYIGGRRVLDVSGDGGNSGGPASHAGLKRAKDALVASGVTINGLPILVVPPAFISPAQPPEGLDVYYREHVVGGVGRFMISSQGFEDFPRAILAKLVAEIA